VVFRERLQKDLRAFGLCALVAIASGCSNQEEQVGITKKRSGGVDPQGAASLDARKAPEVQETPKLAIPDLKGLLKAKYAVNVHLKGRNGPLGLLNLLDLKPCSGEIQIDVNPSMQALETGDISQLLVISAANPIDCPVIQSKIDIAKVLGGLFASPTNQKGLPIAKDGDVLALKSLLGVTYEPARPLFPSLLAGKKEDLAKLSVTRQVTATSEKGTHSGTCSLTMENFDAAYTPPGMSFTFPKTMQFTNRMSGFTGLDPLKGLLFEQLGFRLSVAPIALAQITVGGQADKLLPIVATVPEQALDGILKSALPLLKGVVASDGIDNQLVMSIAKDITVTITIDLKEQEGLDRVNTTPDKGETFTSAVVTK